MFQQKKIGLIINPIAGMGGSVGLKGTDGAAIYKKAVELGAIPHSGNRCRLALENLGQGPNCSFLTCPGEMGENVLRSLNLLYELIELPKKKLYSFEDTISAADQMKQRQVDLLVFSGGDGTARDICSVVGNSLPVLGIPGGVKIHSAVFASHPRNAGIVLEDFLKGKIKSFQEEEVVDLDEEQYRNEVLTARLYGYMKVPTRKGLIQNRKSGTQPGDVYFQKAIAQDLINKMNTDCYYLVGPGSTTLCLLEQLGIRGSLLGIDLVHKKHLLQKDLRETQIIEAIKRKKVKLIISPTGGQGFLFGRGNQQLSAEVLKQIGKENLIIAATPEKINELRGRPLLVDTGDEELDQQLSGYCLIVNGYHQYIYYKVTI